MSETHKLGALDYLKACLNQLDHATQWLERSYRQCKSLDATATLTPEQFDQLENLSSRFARVADILINKVYRAIDSVELLEPGSLIDTVNRAAKRRLIDSVEQARTIKDIRNDIVHEYEVEDLQELLGEVMSLAQVLIDLVHRAQQYAGQYIQ